MGKLFLSEEERTIVDIVNPEKSDKKLPESLPVDFIINNNICYLLYNKVGSELESRYNSDELEPIYRKAKYMDFSINELRDVSKAFEENGINFVFLFKAIESQCDTTDVDTIVEGTQIEKAGKVLEDLGYFVPLFPYEKYNFVKSKGSNEVVLISLQTEEEFKKYHYIVNEEKMSILRNKRKIDGLYVPSFENDLVICLLRMIKKKQIPLGTILHTAYLLENCSDLNYMRDSIKQLWYAPMLQSIYVTNILYKSLFDREIDSPLIPIAERAHEESKILEFLSEKEIKKLKIPYTPNFFLSYWRTCELLINLRNLEFRKIVKSIFKPFIIIAERIKLVATTRKRRLLICFSGIDGTGKTTHATKLVTRFKDMSIPSQYAYCIFEPKISYPFMAFVYLIKGYRRKDYHKSRILRIVWNYIVILDFIYIYFTKVKVPLSIGKNVICDRYVYDWIASLIYNGLYNERASNILLKLIPKPDLVFMLDIPEDISDSRKDDTKDAVNIKDSDSALDYLSVHRRSFLKIAKSLDIPVIDATGDFKDLNEEFYTQIIQTYISKQK